MNYTRLLETALKKCEFYMGEYPEDGALIALEKQLKKLIQADRENKTDNKTYEEINIGLIATKEIVNFDENFADLLCDIMSEVRQLRGENIYKM